MLPPEILEIIILHTDLRTLLRLRTVSWDLSILCAHDRIWKHRVAQDFIIDQRRPARFATWKDLYQNLWCKQTLVVDIRGEEIFYIKANYRTPFLEVVTSILESPTLRKKRETDTPRVFAFCPIFPYRITDQRIWEYAYLEGILFLQGCSYLEGVRFLPQSSLIRTPLGSVVTMYQGRHYVTLYDIKESLNDVIIRVSSDVMAVLPVPVGFGQIDIRSQKIIGVLTVLTLGVSAHYYDYGGKRFKLMFLGNVFDLGHVAISDLLKELGSWRSIQGYHPHIHAEYQDL